MYVQACNFPEFLVLPIHEVSQNKIQTTEKQTVHRT